MTDPRTAEAPRRAPPALWLPRPRREPAGFVTSILLHAAIVALILGGVVGGSIRLSSPGDGSGGPAGGGGGGGGNRVAYIDLPPVGAPAAAAAAATEPVPPVVPPPVEEAPIETPVTVPVETTVAVATAPAESTADSSAGDGTGSGAGVGSGTGGGSGGGTGGGEGTGTGIGIGPGTGGDSTDIIPPQLRNWVPPTERPPRELRGQRITVTFWISADGRVERFETDPEIRDQDYREKFTEIVMKTRFRPARTRAGEAVPFVYPMTFMLQSGS